MCWVRRPASSAATIWSRGSANDPTSPACYAVAEALHSFTASRRPIAQATYRPAAGQRAVAATADELDLNAHRPGGRMTSQNAKATGR